MSDILSELSHALDLTEGAPRGHTLRSCILGMRLADAVSLGPDERAALFYALLLKDAGSSSNSSGLAALYGSDDRLVKPRMKISSRASGIASARENFRNSGMGQPLLSRVRRFVDVSRGDLAMRHLVKVRCERGAEIALRLGLPEFTAQAIRSLDEQWDGAGHPRGLREGAIPVLSRIASLAQSVDLFVTKVGLTDAMGILQERRGTWFDPALTNEVLSWGGDAEWWERIREADTAAVGALEPPSCIRMIDEASVDIVAQVFAAIADAKSPFMYGHSQNVATYAESMARAMGFDDAQRRLLRRAALLHDIGMLGVSSSIIDKVAPLAPLERFEIQAHPLHTFEILSGVSVFQEVAKLAAAHHEKLDGSGYPWGLDADQLDPMARTLVVADVFEAAMADRAFRRGLSRDEALSVLEHHRGLRLWGEAIDALAASVGTDEEMAEL